MTFEKLKVPTGQSSLARLVWFQSLTVKNNSVYHQSVFYIKNSIFFILIKKQNISNQSSLVIGPISFLISSKLIFLDDCWKA